MLQRLFVHFSLILLFAFTQMGIVTHEISHFSDFAKTDLAGSNLAGSNLNGSNLKSANLAKQTNQSGSSQQHQQDKNSANHQCEQCIAHAGIANHVPSSQLVFAQTPAGFTASVAQSPYFPSTTYPLYSARAPPQTA